MSSVDLRVLLVQSLVSSLASPFNYMIILKDASDNKVIFIFFLVSASSFLDDWSSCQTPYLFRELNGGWNIDGFL